MQQRYLVTVFHGRARTVEATSSGQWFPVDRLQDAALTARARKALNGLNTSTEPWTISRRR
jgi:hypothetical protein